MRIIPFILLLILILGSVSFAHTVKMNFRFNINGTDEIRVNDTTYFNNGSANYAFGNTEKKYMASNSSSSAAALVFAGSKMLGMSLIISTGNYTFQMKQEELENRFLVAFTKGSWKDIDDDIFSVRNILSKTFGNFAVIAPESFPIFLRLEYEDINILNSFVLGRGSHTVLIKNYGDGIGVVG